MHLGFWWIDEAGHKIDRVENPEEWFAPGAYAEAVRVMAETQGRDHAAYRVCADNFLGNPPDRFLRWQWEPDDYVLWQSGPLLRRRYLAYNFAGVRVLWFMYGEELYVHQKDVDRARGIDNAVAAEI